MTYICSHNIGVWRSWLAHLLWEQGVEGSSPFTPTDYQVVTVSVAAFVLPLNDALRLFQILCVSRCVSNFTMLTISVQVICYNVRPLRDSSYPLMLRLTQHRKRKYISLGISVKEKDWDFKKNVPRKSCPDREAILKLISDKVSAYNSLIMELTAKQQEFTMSTLIQTLENRKKVQTVGQMYDYIINELRKSDKLGNMEVYKYSRDSLIKFHKSLDIPFSDINCQWLERYETWLHGFGCKDTTVSQLFRTLRSVFNRALSMKLIKQDIYPFNDFKVSKFDVRTKKRAVSKEDVRKIMSLDLSGERQYMQFARDIFLFSYFGAGINFSDIALLRYCDISDSRVRYIRKKTGKDISFSLSDAGCEIISRYSRPDAKQDDYIFPILDRKKHRTEIQRKNRIHKVLRHVNTSLAEIGKMAGLETHLTTYIARHTFATVLKRSGVNIAIISESMGHSDIATTQIYLDSFENSQIDEAMKNLL